MKIIFLVDRWSKGGVPTVMKTLSEALPKTDEILWVFYYTGNHNEKRFDQIELNARFSGDPKAIFKLRKTLNEFKPDIIHDHFGGIWSAFFLFSRWRKKAVLHYHNELNVIKDSPDHRRTFKEGFFKHVLLKYYAKVVAVSHHNGETLKKFLPESKISVIPNGIFIPNQISEKKPSSVLRIGYIGRLVYEKGLDTLLETMSLLSEKAAVSLEIAGEGDSDYSDGLKQFVKEKSLNKVRFRGWVSDKEAFFSEIDVMYFGSRQEPFGLTILESWANRVPVIGFYPENGGGPLELIPLEQPQGGFLLRKRKSEKLLEVLNELIRNPEKIKEWESQISAIITKYDIRDIAKDWQKLYKSVSK